MVRIALSVLLILWFSQSAFGGETIYAKEVESYMYANGKMEHLEGQFEITYFLDGDKITRTRVYDLKKKEVIPDNIIYHVYKQLSSDPNLNLLSRKKMIRAIGQPGTDSVEILAIEINGDWIQSVRSSADYFVISRLKRIK